MNNKSPNLSRSPDWVRIASMIFCIIAALAAAYVAFKYLFALLLPLLLGAGIGILSSALAAKLEKHTQASKKTVSFAVLLFLLAVFIAILFLTVKRLISELGNLADGIGENGGMISDFFDKASKLISDMSNKIASFFPNRGEAENNKTAEKINEYISTFLGDSLSAIGSAIPGILTSLLSALPDLFLGVVVTIITAFYFTLDTARIKRGIRSILPSSAERIISHIKKEAAVAVIGYLRSYSIIMLITFAEIFFGLSVLGIEYSFLIAAVSAVIDILPVLGVGIILLPWAIFCLIGRNLFRGIGLIILYVIIVIVRQFIEPKIVGESLGVHPLLALSSFYIGYRLFGFAGIIIAPILLVLWRAIKEYSGKEKLKSI